MRLPNYFCHLTGACFGGDVQCPKCQKKYDVEWDTEYGQPLTGCSQEVSCPNCSTEFAITADVETTYRVVT